LVYEQPLRKSTQLPLPRNDLEKMDYYYELQLSLLLTGTDEFLWTSYCTVDTIHGSERSTLKAVGSSLVFEPATGGSKILRQPMWCPREFFLTVLHRRMRQAVREFKALVDALDQRMKTYVSFSTGIDKKL
jgi:hypothetical protein